MQVPITYKSNITGTQLTTVSCTQLVMEMQAILLLVISGFMLAAGNGLEESLDEFGKELQNEIDVLKESIAAQDQQIKNISSKTDKLQENITETYKDVQKGTYNNIDKSCTNSLVMCCTYITVCRTCAGKFIAILLIL